MVCDRLVDRVINGRKVLYRYHIVGVRSQASVIIVKSFLDDRGGIVCVQRDLVDAAEHLADLIFVDGLLLVHIQVGQRQILCCGDVAAIFELLCDLAL